MHALTRTWLGAATAAACALGIAPSLHAQVVPCDFDIADDLGTWVWGSTVHLAGRAGASTYSGAFLLINGNNPDTDVDKDGYGLGCDFHNIYIPSEYRTVLRNVDDPALAIPAENIIIYNLPRDLPSGTQARVEVYVELPPGTVAGRYIGQFQVRDDSIFAADGPNGEILNADALTVEVLVLAEHDLAVVSADSAAALDSLVLRGAAGERATGVFRIANTGNAPITDARVTVSDLRSESAVGLVIPAERVSVSTPTVASVGVGDTARVAVTVAIPRGTLGGRYRGTITVQGQDTDPIVVPLILIVTSARGILFADNPVRGGAIAVARFAFNGDPGSPYRVGIFTSDGLLVWTDQGTVFPGAGGTETVVGPGADFAVNYSWPLRNGRGEQVASGVYVVVVESVVNGRRQVARDKLMVIR